MYRARQQAAVRKVETAISYLNLALAFDDAASLRKAIQETLSVLDGAAVKTSHSANSVGIAKPSYGPKPVSSVAAPIAAPLPVAAPVISSPDAGRAAPATAKESMTARPAAIALEDSSFSGPARNETNPDLAALKNLFGDAD